MWKPSLRCVCVPQEAFQQLHGLAHPTLLWKATSVGHVPAGRAQAVELVLACGLLPFLQAGSSSSSTYCCAVRCSRNSHKTEQILVKPLMSSQCTSVQVALLCNPERMSARRGAGFSGKLLLLELNPKPCRQSSPSPAAHSLDPGSQGHAFPFGSAP